VGRLQRAVEQEKMSSRILRRFPGNQGVIRQTCFN
jgi:hypothetical protein